MHIYSCTYQLHIYMVLNLFEIVNYLIVLVLLLGWWQLDKTSIIIDASKYIEELKEKVERLNQDVANAQTSSDQNTLPMVY